MTEQVLEYSIPEIVALAVIVALPTPVALKVILLPEALVEALKETTLSLLVVQLICEESLLVALIVVESPTSKVAEILLTEIEGVGAIPHASLVALLVSPQILHAYSG